MLILAALAASSLLSDLHVERANEFTSSTQDAVVLATDDAGRSVIAWHSRRQQGGTYGVYARSYDRDGSALGGEVQLNSTTQSHQRTPSVALDESGAWAAWVSYLQDGDYGAIVARRFDAALANPTDELIVNEDARGNQSEVVLDSDAQGRALVAWTSPAGDETPRGLFARWLSADGEALGTSFRVDAADGHWAHRPSLSVAADGSAIIVWARTPDGAIPDGIFARRLDSEGTLVGEPFRVSPAERGGAIEPVTSLAGDGGFVTAWLELRGYGWAVATRHFELGEDEGGEVLEVESGVGGYVSGLSISAREDGGFAIAWNLITQGSDRKSDIYVQRFDANHELLGEALQVTSDQHGEQRLSQADGTRKLHYGSDGSLIVAWSGDADLGDSKGAHLSWLTPEGQQLSATREAPTPEADEARADESPQPATAEVPETPAPHDPPVFDPNHQPSPIAVETSFLGTSGLFGFQGIPNTGWDPPDPNMAVGPNHVVMVTNGGIAFYDTNGSFQFQDVIEGGGGFWGSVGATSFVFDPEAIYDPHSGRFMVSACERGSNGQPYFLFAVSDDSDPNGTWHKYRLNVQSEAGDTDIDSQNLAVDAQAIYLTADFFGPDKFLVFIVDKASVLSGGAASTTSTVLNGRQSLGVPVNYDAAAPRQYMVWSPESGSSNALTIYAINNPLTTPSLQNVTVSVPAFTQPEDPPQSGTSVRPETFESRFWSCVYRNGSLWATHHVNSSRVRQRWYEIDVAGWPTGGTPSLVQWGEVDPGGTTRTFFGSIGVDALGNMALTFAQSSPTDLISMNYVYRRVGDAPGTTSNSALARASTSTSVGGRWGDYSSMVADPLLPGTFWGYHEYKTSVWRTWAQRFTLCTPPTTYCTSSPNSTGAGAFIGWSGGASIAANDLVLNVAGGSTNQSGIFYYGPNQIATPFGDGVRCVGGTTHRLPVTTTDIFGDASFALDYTALTGQGMIFAGDTRQFQFWYRDPAFGGAGFNLSNGLSIQFCP